MVTRRAPGRALLLLLAGCSPEVDVPESPPPPVAEQAPELSDLLDGRPLPPHGRPEMVAEFREAEAVEFSPSDGKGTASIDPSAPVPASGSGAWTITFEAGPLGIAAGGALVVQVSPFWGWTEPQPFDERYPGFTRVETDSPGTRLSPEPCGQNCLRVGVEETALAGGSHIFVHYGAPGPGEARVDRFAEEAEDFFLRVDGDGDGVAALLDSAPGLDILPGPARSLHVVVPSRAQVGETVWVQVAALDSTWNAATDFVGDLRVVEAAGLEGLPERIELRSEDRGWRRLEAVASRPGISRVVVETEGLDVPFRSNPLEIGRQTPRTLWADLHGHSALSDGSGSPEQYLAYARDFAALDVASLTDHDHFGMRFLDRSPQLWDRIRRAVASAHEPGRFVTILGFEWTNWLFGHRHVLYFEGEGEVISSIDPESDEPEELWARLAGRDALTIAHHPGGGPVPVDWSVRPDPRFEPVVEIVSVHGSSECLECPARIYSPVPGSFVRDALGRGYRLGIIGSGDTHDGHPGMGSPGNQTVGLAAVLADRLDRDSVLAALRSRRVYATSGPRILVEFGVSGARMGEVLRLPTGAPARQIYARAVGTGPLARLDVVKNGEVRFSIEGAEETLELVAEDTDPIRPGEYLYLRVMQADGGLAWSSPVFVEESGD
jgi:hypothetical protein